MVARVLRALEWVANPALAGLAFLVLSLGIVTWLPALAAAATALRAWRGGDDQRCFVGTLQAFPALWRKLWKHGLLSTLAVSVLVSNVVFLAGTGAWPLLAVQVGIGAALIPYHLALAVTHRPHDALVLAFGSPKRGLLLLGAAVLAPLATLPLAFGPLLFGPTLPLLVALFLDAQAKRRAAALRMARDVPTQNGSLP